ncbi:MAG: cation:proton antiporter, partial [Myxococcota bacterium]
SIGLLLGAGLCVQALALGWLHVEGYAGVAIFALCLALSSTAIVVEGLKAHGATHTPYGQAILELMLFQDVVAVVGMSLLGLPGEGQSVGEKWSPVSLLLQFVVFTGAAIFLGRTVLVRIIERIRYDEGLLVIFVLGLAAGLGGLAMQNGFSPTMAGFLAGVALSFTPHRSAIEYRIEPLKVFGVTIYFIFMGVTLPLNHLAWGLFWPVVLVTVLIVGVRPLCSVWLARWGGMSSREATRFGLSIGQGSEFSMILAASALHVGMFDESAFLVVVLASVLSMVISSWVQLSFQGRGFISAVEADAPAMEGTSVAGE